MKFCHNCGAKLDDAENFCSECGPRVTDDEPTKKSEQPAENNNPPANKNSSNTTLLLVLAIIFAIGGLFVYASKQPNQISAKKTFDDTYYISVGYDYLDKKEYNKAIENCKKALELNPNASDAYWQLGYAYFEIGDYSAAIFNYQKAVEIKPNDASAYFNMGLAYERLGIYDNELNALNRAIELEPNNESYRTARDNVLNYLRNAGAQSALEQYYNFIASANPRAAFNMLSYDMQNYMNGLDNFSRSHANVTLNRISNVKTISSSGNSAVLEYRLDSNCWENGRDVHRAFQGTATLEKIWGSWIITDLRVNTL